MLLLHDVTTGGNIGLVLPVGIVVCRELPSHIIWLYNAKIHPYLVSSCFHPSLSCLLLVMNTCTINSIGHSLLFTNTSATLLLLSDSVKILTSRPCYPTLVIKR